jgi:membrane protein DedA with SNARE-associated domain
VLGGIAAAVGGFVWFLAGKAGKKPCPKREDKREKKRR